MIGGTPADLLSSNLYDCSGGMDQVRVFIDDQFSAVMTKVGSISSSGVDPVELLPEAARELATALLVLADRLDERDGEPLPPWPSRS